MKVLALELSSSVGSVALRDRGGDQLKVFPADRKDSGLFYENLSAILESCGAPETIVVGLGPGSYAGVRIAIATAIGLRAASGAHLFGLPSICAFELEEYLVVGDARRNSFFFARVADGTCVEGPILAIESEVRAFLGARPDLPAVATQALPQFERVCIAHPSALRMAELALRVEGEGEEMLEPIYLREPHITTASR
ncbi:MAG TPA: tRNA (adenosine(37)-N6)-threonylcarbamoyltransferase complex dimerization subunit type 1 TsaB [Chthoniobacterales bacterium]|jgi:tRNA threonylcarbamoyladenosine biosynthesis protein TsaB